jgi:transcriptional regulator with XRE-family HTH domain
MAMADVTLNKMVGDRVRVAREEAGLSLEDVGKRMGDYLPRPLAKQTMHQIEQGDREVKVSELLALADILNRRLLWFLDPLRAEDVVVFPNQLQRKNGREIWRILAPPAAADAMGLFGLARDMLEAQERSIKSQAKAITAFTQALEESEALEKANALEETEAPHGED